MFFLSLRGRKKVLSNFPAMGKPVKCAAAGDERNNIAAIANHGINRSHNITFPDPSGNNGPQNRKSPVKNRIRNEALRLASGINLIHLLKKYKLGIFPCLMKLPRFPRIFPRGSPKGLKAPTLDVHSPDTGDSAIAITVKLPLFIIARVRFRLKKNSGGEILRLHIELVASVRKIYRAKMNAYALPEIRPCAAQGCI